MAQLDKPIIHFQIPLKEDNGQHAEDNFAVSLGGITFFKEWVNKELGGKFHIIATPFDIDIIGAEVEKVKLDTITLKEFFDKYDIKGGIVE